MSTQLLGLLLYDLGTNFSSLAIRAVIKIKRQEDTQICQLYPLTIEEQKDAKEIFLECFSNNNKKPTKEQDCAFRVEELIYKKIFGHKTNLYFTHFIFNAMRHRLHFQLDYKWTEINNMNLFDMAELLHFNYIWNFKTEDLIEY